MMSSAAVFVEPANKLNGSAHASNLSCIKAQPSLGAKETHAHSSASQLPAAASSQVYCQLHALDTGTLALPEKDFLHDGQAGAAFIAPSMSFLIEHRGTRVMFDLGLRRSPAHYGKALEQHIATRAPFEVPNEARDCLAAGGVTPDMIDAVVLSHVHWDHYGEPSHFSTSRFIVGAGSLDLLDNGGPAAVGVANHFDPELLDRERTWELPKPVHYDVERFPKAYATSNKPLRSAARTTGHTWAPLGPFPAAIDYFGDGSFYLIDSPGHLLGHINALVRVGPQKWVFLGGDAAHHPDLLRGTREIATWDTPRGCGCVHVDPDATRTTLARIRALQQQEDAHVEIVLAHDFEWRSRNAHRFFPSSL